MADYTSASLVWIYILMGLFVAGAAFFLVQALASGAVSGDEAPKYRMLEDEDLGASGASVPATGGGNHE